MDIGFIYHIPLYCLVVFVTSVNLEPLGLSLKRWKWPWQCVCIGCYEMLNFIRVLFVFVKCLICLFFFCILWHRYTYIIWSILFHSPCIVYLLLNYCMAKTMIIFFVCVFHLVHSELCWMSMNLKFYYYFCWDYTSMMINCTFRN